jgi:hypothetical protein
MLMNKKVVSVGWHTGIAAYNLQLMYST